MTEMNVLFYIPLKSEVNEEIYRLVDRVSLFAGTKVFQSIEDLSRRLCRPAYEGPTVVVLLAGNKKDLLNMVSISHLLSDTPIILILPDRKENTTAMGYTLCPRFLTYADSNLDEVVAVLGKMFGNYQKKGLGVEQGIVLM